MSIELTRRYLDATLENKEDQVRSFLNEESCETHFETGFDNFGPDEICLNNDVFFDCIEWLDVQVINQYESKIIDNAYSYALLEAKGSGKFKDENLTFQNLGCQLFKWSHDHLLVTQKFFGNVLLGQNSIDKIKAPELSSNVEENVNLNGKNAYFSIVNNQIGSNLNCFSPETSVSILSHEKEAIHDIQLEEFKKRYQKLNIRNKNLIIETSFASGNTSIVESKITGNEESNLPFEMRECFISEWVGNKIVNCRLYSVKVPSLEERMESIDKF